MDYSKIGERLRLIRERKGLSYEQIFEVTRIQPSVLKNIEEGKPSVSPVFLKGFIKTYSRSLGLDPEELFKLESGTGEKKTKRKETKTRGISKSKKYNYLKYILPPPALLISALFLFTLFKKDGGEKLKNDREARQEKTKILKEQESVPSTVKEGGQEEIKERREENPSQEDFTAKKEGKAPQENVAKEKEDFTGLFYQIKNSLFKQDILIRASEPLQIYFKADRQTTITKNLQPFIWFHIKAQERIYFRLDEKRGNIDIFHNGKGIDMGKERFFERVFQ